MPGGDGTGPAGMGPMTGRAVGYCAGYPAPGFMNMIPGRGFWGRGRGGGGWQRAGYGYPAFGGVPYGPAYAAPFAPAMTREQEVEMLKRQAKYFEDALAAIKKRIEEQAEDETIEKLASQMM